MDGSEKCNELFISTGGERSDPYHPEGVTISVLVEVELQYLQIG